jgi:hypothetical protein
LGSGLRAYDEGAGKRALAGKFDPLEGFVLHEAMGGEQVVKAVALN